MTDLHGKHVSPASLQPAREQNIQALVDYFQGGCKPGARKLGVEVEHILVDAAGRPLTYSQPHGVADVLRTLSAKYPKVTMHGDDILGVAKSWMNVTIEPAAQLELSAGPFDDFERMQEAFQEFEDDVAEALVPVGGRVLTIGYDPVMRAVDKELIPKARYEFMNSYLSAISPFGPRMMRGSASTQVSIDFESEQDACVKMRVASILAPVLALICDNTPVFEGEPSPHPLMRTEVWRYLDPDRCNTAPDVLEPDYSFRDYAEYILDVPAIVAPDGGDEMRYDTRTFGEIYADTPMQLSDVEHALSMVWPDARLKYYVEIRPADSLPIAETVAYAALIKGIFYSDALQQLNERFADVRTPDVEAAKDSLMANGYDGETYGVPVAQLADDLIALANAGLPEDERHWLEPLAKLVAARTTMTQLSDLV